MREAFIGHIMIAIGAGALGIGIGVAVNPIRAEVAAHHDAVASRTNDLLALKVDNDAKLALAETQENNLNARIDVDCQIDGPGRAQAPHRRPAVAMDGE